MRVEQELGEGIGSFEVRRVTGAGDERGGAVWKRLVQETRFTHEFCVVRARYDQGRHVE